MQKRIKRVAAAVLVAAVGLCAALAAPAPAWADGRENQIQVGQTTYYGLPQALGALGAGDQTMTLLGDVEADLYYGQSASLQIKEGQNVTLNLNGFDIDAEGYSLQILGSLTINNGTAYDTGDVAFEPWGAAPGIVLSGAGSLTLASGEISGDNGPAVQLQGSGSFTMTGGQVDSDIALGVIALAQGATGRVAISGGSVENGAYNGAIISVGAGQEGQVQVSGGTFEPTAIPAAFLSAASVQVGLKDGRETTYNVGSNEGILSYLNRFYRGSVSVVNGTLNITQAIPLGVTITAQAPGVLQVNGTPQQSYTGTGQPPASGGATTPTPDNPTPGPGGSTPGGTNPYPPYENDDMEPVYRLYNPVTYGRYYTEDDDEVWRLVSLGWLSEGVGWNAPDNGYDVYQLYNPYNGDHYWTADWGEYQSLQRVGWRGEGDAWESAPATTGVPIYQLYNPYLKVNTHLWTSDAHEVEVLVGMGWQNEDAKWYAASLPR